MNSRSSPKRRRDWRTHFSNGNVHRINFGSSDTSTAIRKSVTLFDVFFSSNRNNNDNNRLLLLQNRRLNQSAQTASLTKTEWETLWRSRDEHTFREVPYSCFGFSKQQQTFLCCHRHLRQPDTYHCLTSFSVTEMRQKITKFKVIINFSYFASSWNINMNMVELD